MKYIFSLFFLMSLSFFSLQSAEGHSLTRALEKLTLPRTASPTPETDLSHDLQKLYVEKEELSFGERLLLEACKKGDRQEAHTLVVDQHISPNFQDPHTGLSPFHIALHTNKHLADFLLKQGAKPDAYLSPTESVYSESFTKGDNKAISFLLRHHVPYATIHNKSTITECRKEDLKRLVAAGKFLPLAQAFNAGLITKETVTPQQLRHALHCQHKNPHFEPRIITLLTILSKQENNRPLKRLQQSYNFTLTFKINR
jgi:hypothetical protein